MSQCHWLPWNILCLSEPFQKGKPYQKGRLSTVDLTVLTSSDQWHFIEIVPYLLYKTSITILMVLGVP
jgi:hypothetical protein